LAQGHSGPSPSMVTMRVAAKVLVAATAVAIGAIPAVGSGSPGGVRGTGPVPAWVDWLGSGSDVRERRLDGHCVEDLNQARPVVTISPTCQACGVIIVEGSERCMYDLSECQGIRPGGSCNVKCRAPYIGPNSTVATCPLGNTNPFRSLSWSPPNCSCPDPEIQQGYVKDSDGEWQCAQGYAGTAMTMCEPIGTACGGLRTWLAGCLPMVPCATPRVDGCRNDVSACASVEPGGTCEVRCRWPFKGGTTIATCPSKNTDSTRELDYFPLTCTLNDCADPNPFPEGYNKTADGKWTCADGYFGTALNKCEPGDKWAQDRAQGIYPCRAVAKLTGCEKLVPCSAPKLEGLDQCTYDVEGCQSVPGGQTCKVFCKSPFEGENTEGFCPLGNVDRNGLTWTKPTCVLQECADPGIVPQGYMKTNSGWQCEQSYTGFAAKSCAVNMQCEEFPVLSGCAQLMPCEAPTDAGCEYNVYDCSSVQPGGSCSIRCKGEFTGTLTTGTCAPGNTDPHGLQYTLPTCHIGKCEDPKPLPPGYVKLPGDDDNWMCGIGYAGNPNKTCTKIPGSCRPIPSLQGCLPEVPCAPLQFDNPSMACMINTTECLAVPAGGECIVRCMSPHYHGPFGRARCPAKNTDPFRELDLYLQPDCGCIDPSPPPPGYNKTQASSLGGLTGRAAQEALARLGTGPTGGWQCANGYIGEPRKHCRPSSSCEPQPVLTGCQVPVACDVSGFVDDGSGQGMLSGSIQWGPALYNDSGHGEDEILGYEVFWADDCNKSMGGRPISKLFREKGRPTCCQGDTYTAEIKDLRPPVGAAGLIIFARAMSGPAPVGIPVPLPAELVAKRATLSFARSQAALAELVVLVAVVAAVFSGAA